jgi:hypothetical protein
MKRFFRRLSCFVDSASADLFSRVLLVCLAFSGCLGAATYYVDASMGQDDNSGQEASPFRTIQKAANVMSSGDSCLVRTGTYRETVTVKTDNTTYKVESGHTATISGAEPVTGWSKHSGSIYKAPMSWDLGEGLNQVFVAGTMMLEARWPNTTSLDPTRPVLASSDSGSDSSTSRTAILVDSALPSLDWTGAIAHVATGKAWLGFTGNVTSSSSGKLSIYWHTSVDPDSRSYSLTGNNGYYLISPRALDSAGEWYLQSGQLYLWCPENANPENVLVEAKRRTIGMDLSGRNGVTVEGFAMRACTVVMDGDTQSCTLKSLDVRYVDHFTLIEGGGWTYRTRDTGIRMNGTGNTLLDSTVDTGAGNIVTIAGTNNVVDNCDLFNGSYAGTDCGIVYVVQNTSGHKILRSRLYNSGRSVLIHRKAKGLQIMYNNMSSAGLQYDDQGITYCYETDGGGTVIAYNLVHDNENSGTNPLGEGATGAGIYLDEDSSNFLVHHNVTWNVTHGIIINGPSENNKIYNNTLAANDNQNSIRSAFDESLSGTIIRNNIFCNKNRIQDDAYGYTADHNTEENFDAKFVDRDNLDFSLRSDSPCIDAGVDVGIGIDLAGTAIPQGKAPDQGAYEYTKNVVDKIRPAAPTGLKVMEP